MTSFFILISLFFRAEIAQQTQAAEEASVFSVHQGVALGNPGETTRIDYFVSAGTKHGLKVGAFVEVYRKQPAFDDQTQKWVGDYLIPFAKMKVVHVEDSMAVGRLDSAYKADQTAAVSPLAVMVGDIVRVLPSGKK